MKQLRTGGYLGSVSKEVTEINPDTVLNPWHFYLYFMCIGGTVFGEPFLALLHFLMPDNLNYDRRERRDEPYQEFLLLFPRHCRVSGPDGEMLQGYEEQEGQPCSVSSKLKKPKRRIYIKISMKHGMVKIFIGSIATRFDCSEARLIY